MEKLWSEWSFQGLATEAQTGLRGQGAVIESTRRLVEAIEHFDKGASRQATWMIRLTVAILVLTVAIVALTVVLVVKSA